MTLTGDFVTGQTVSFQRMRALVSETALQEGVVGVTDLQVIQRAAGANMSVDVGAGAAWVQVDTGTRNGLAHVYNDAAANVVVTASNGTNPRIDQIIIRYNDTTIPTGSGNVPTLEVVTGTATSGATLDNRTGATALPNDCLRLADLLIPTSSTSVTTANIRDRRPWARGAYFRTGRSTGAASYSTTSATVALIDSANIQPRIECSGVPVRLKLEGFYSHSVAGGNTMLGFWMDGAFIDGFGNTSGVGFDIFYAPLNTGAYRFTLVQDIAPTAGSHLLGPVFAVSTAGTSTLYGAANSPLFFTAEEIIRPNASNT